MAQTKKAIYNVKGKPQQRVVVIGVTGKQHANNLLTYIAAQKGWLIDTIRVQVKRCNFYPQTAN